jgi:hypothetical protein
MVLKWLPWTGTPQRPVEVSGKEHNCPTFKDKGKNNYSVKEKWVNIMAEDFEFCQFCANFTLTEKAHEKYPNVHYISKEEHIKLFHPNDKVLDFIDLKCITDEDKVNLRKQWNHPKNNGLYYLEGILLQQDTSMEK